MIVNGNEISNVTVLSKVITPSSFETSSKWSKQSLIPINVKSKFTYGSMKLELLVRGNSEEITEDNTSFLLKEISESILTFNNYFYKVRMSSVSVDDIFKDELKEDYCQKITLNLIVDEKYKEEIVTELELLGSSISLNVEGNKETPCVLEITPTQAMVDLVINGVTKDAFTIENLAKDQKLIIDGENQTITVDGVNKFLDTDMWDYPFLIAGENNITFSKSYLTGIIKYKPRYV